MLFKTPLTALRLTAAELGISQHTYNHLLRVRDDLDEHSHGFIDGAYFDMRYWNADCFMYHQRCIGGMMSRNGWRFGWAKRFTISLGLSTTGLIELLFPRIDRDWASLSAKSAVIAIDHWMAGNKKDCWNLALSV